MPLTYIYNHGHILSALLHIVLAAVVVHEKGRAKHVRPQFAHESVGLPRQIGRIAADYVVGCFALLAFAPLKKKNTDEDTF